MSVYKALAAAVQTRGQIMLPDGKTYPVAGVSVGDLLQLQRLTAEGADDAVVLPFYVDVAMRVTGASRATIEALAPDGLAEVVGMAQFGIDAVAKAMQSEAPASGNGHAAPTMTRRSTSRKKR